MEELLKHLTEVSIRQQQIVEHMAARQGEVEREVAALRTASAQRVPLLDPRVRATTLLPKMTVHDDVESFLLMFESIASQEGWPRDEWARVLAPLLTGEPQRAYFAMPPELTGSYEDLKKEILSRVGLSPVAAAQLVHEWEYSSRLPARAQAADLSRLTRHWLLAGDPSAAQVADRVVVDRLLRALPRPIRQAAGMRNPLTVGELVEAIELAEAAQRREAGERMPIPRRVPQERRSPEGTFRPVGRPAAPVPQDEPMPTEPPTAPRRAWLAGCILHQEPPPAAPKVDVEVNGRPYRALLDSGSAVSLVQSTVVSPRPGSRAVLPITCVHGDTRQVPTRRVTISAAPGSWPIEVGLMKDLPVPVLLGRDWPGFDRLLALATQPASPAGSRRTRRFSRRPRQRPVLLASDSPRDGESPSQSANLFFDVFQQVKGGGTFAKEQLGDDRLKHCWTQVRVTEGKDVQPSPHPVPHFIVQNGLLYCVAPRRGEEKQLLVVPRPKTETVMELAHSHPMAGHLGALNTIQRIRDRFHWPGLDAEVKRFCRACPTCQRTSPSTPPPSPLIPLPIIEVPFERIGMDLVGPLPKSARGHEHILVVVDYATRYPEAIPLRKATSKAIAQELFLCVAGSASQPRYWPTKVRRSCPGPWQTSVASCRSNSSAPPCTTRRPMGWWKDSTRPWNGCSVEWPRRIGATGTGCSRMFCSESGRYPKRPPASPHLNSSSDVSLADYSTSPRRPGSNSRPPIGPPSNTSGKWGNGSTELCPWFGNTSHERNRPNNATITGPPNHGNSNLETLSWS